LWWELGKGLITSPETNRGLAKLILGGWGWGKHPHGFTRSKNSIFQRLFFLILMFKHG